MPRAYPDLLGFAGADHCVSALPAHAQAADDPYSIMRPEPGRKRNRARALAAAEIPVAARHPRAHTPAAPGAIAARADGHGAAADPGAGNRPRAAQSAGDCRRPARTAPRPSRTAPPAAPTRPASMATPPATAAPISAAASISRRLKSLHHLRIGDHREQRGAADHIADQHRHHELHGSSATIPNRRRTPADRLPCCRRRYG